MTSERDVIIPVGDAKLEGDLVVPEDAGAIVAFAHGSGSSRHSSRNRAVAEELNGAGLATLLFDLLTEHEDRVDQQTGELRFDIDLLAERLTGATHWLRDNDDTKAMAIGYFGASTGAAAALVAATELPDVVGAIVSRGGRPDLAGDSLERVTAPTLLIVGGNDTAVIQMNREALARLRCEKSLEIVKGATHLFEEPGALDEVSRLARDWFADRLTG